MLRCSAALLRQADAARAAADAAIRVAPGALAAQGLLLEAPQQRLLAAAAAAAPKSACAFVAEAAAVAKPALKALVRCQGDASAVVTTLRYLLPRLRPPFETMAAVCRCPATSVALEVHIAPIRGFLPTVQLVPAADGNTWSFNCAALPVSKEHGTWSAQGPAHQPVGRGSPDCAAKRSGVSPAGVHLQLAVGGTGAAAGEGGGAPGLHGCAGARTETQGQLPGGQCSS